MSSSILLFVFIGCFGVAYAAAGMLTALPPAGHRGDLWSEHRLPRPRSRRWPSRGRSAPGPSRRRRTPPHTSQWETFVQQCQSLADRRGLASLAILVISLIVSGAGLFWVLRKPRSRDSDSGTSDDGGLDQPSYAPLGLQDSGVLVGAGAVAGGSAPVATWPPAPPPGYGPPPAYPGQPVPPPYPGAYPEPGYPQQAWPPQPPSYPSPPQPAGYPQAPTHHQGPAQPQPPAYPQAPAYPAPQAPVDPPPAHPPIAPPAPGTSSAPIPLPPPDAGNRGEAPGPEA